MPTRFVTVFKSIVSPYWAIESVNCSTVQAEGERPLSKLVLVFGARGVVTGTLRPGLVLVIVSPIPFGNLSRRAIARYESWERRPSKNSRSNMFCWMIGCRAAGKLLIGTGNTPHVNDSFVSPMGVRPR